MNERTRRLVAGAVLEAVRTQDVPTATGRTRTVTASLGLALFDSELPLSGEEVLVNADLAMYDAKEAGRDRLAAYATAEPQKARLAARMSWADMIRDALAEDRFVLHAQPIVDLATGEATQHELLLRMRAPDGELIGPATFLPVAERFDLMPAIDRWVAAHAIRMVGAERRRGRELTVYLKHLPFDYLKIDGEFVRHSAGDPTDQLVIQAVVDIARGMGKKTIAEHVGDAQTAALLHRMGVDHGQGFHLGKPAPLADWLPEPAAALPS